MCVWLGLLDGKECCRWTSFLPCAILRNTAPGLCLCRANAVAGNCSVERLRWRGRQRLVKVPCGDRCRKTRARLERRLPGRAIIRGGSQAGGLAHAENAVVLTVAAAARGHACIGSLAKRQQGRKTGQSQHSDHDDGHEPAQQLHLITISPRAEVLTLRRLRR